MARLRRAPRPAVDARVARGTELDLDQGCDAANGTYYQLYSDDRGVCRVYEMRIGGGDWTLWRAGAPFAQRFSGSFEDGGDTIVGRWEKAEDGTNFELDFDLIYRRAR